MPSYPQQALKDRQGPGQPAQGGSATYRRALWSGEPRRSLRSIGSLGTESGQFEDRSPRPSSHHRHHALGLCTHCPVAFSQFTPAGEGQPGGRSQSSVPGPWGQDGGQDPISCCISYLQTPPGPSGWGGVGGAEVSERGKASPQERPPPGLRKSLSGRVPAAPPLLDRPGRDAWGSRAAAFLKGFPSPGRKLTRSPGGPAGPSPPELPLGERRCYDGGPWRPWPVASLNMLVAHRLMPFSRLSWPLAEGRTAQH